jgi:hypothetical protein
VVKTAKRGSMANLVNVLEQASQET